MPQKDFSFPVTDVMPEAKNVQVGEESSPSRKKYHLSPKSLIFLVLNNWLESKGPELI